MSKKNLAVKSISVILVIATLFSALAITASAASYSTGNYTVAASNGVNVRPYVNASSRYGAASKGTNFKVTQISGNWGYTPSIYCANGKTVSGWLCLDYCTYKGSSHTHNYNGGRYYESAHPHEISVRCTSYDSCGGWKWTGETYKVEGCSQCYPSTATYYTLYYNANGGSNGPSSQRVQAGVTFNLSSSKPTRSGYTFLGWSTNKNATSASFNPGGRVRLNGNTTLYAVWKKNASATVYASSVSLSSSSCTMNTGNTKTLTAYVYPSNTTNKSVTWYSNRTSVATVSSSGKITAKSPGTAVITATTSNGKTASCTVTVKGIKISCNYLYYENMAVGDIQYLTATAYPSDTSKFTWSSSNSKVVSINSSGKMTAKAAGTATITVKTADGRTASQRITVTNPAKWRTGNFDTGYTAKGYTTVTLNKNAGDGYIYIYTYDAMGKKSSGQMHVTLRDSSGNWVWEGDVASGSKLKLGNDHLQYRVYIAKKSYPNTIIGNGDDFINVGKCQSWAINCSKNCYIG